MAQTVFQNFEIESLNLRANSSPNPSPKFALFSGNISVYEHDNGPKIDLMDSILTLIKTLLKAEFPGK